MNLKDKLHEVVYVPINKSEIGETCIAYWDNYNESWMFQKTIKEISGYVLTGEELRKLLEDVFDAGERFGFSDGADISEHTMSPDKQTFIDNLTI